MALGRIWRPAESLIVYISCKSASLPETETNAMYLFGPVLMLSDYAE